MRFAPSPHRLVLAAAVVIALLAPVRAASLDVTLSGRITDGALPVAGTLVEVLSGPAETVVASATSDALDAYSLVVHTGTYPVRVTPPAGSGFGTVLLPGVVLVADTDLDIVLVPAGAVTLSGRILDGAGTGVPNQEVSLRPAAGGSNVFVRTDVTGEYRFSVAAGRYAMGVNGNNPDFTYAVPGVYILNLGEIDLSGSAVFDIALPVQPVDVRVHDPTGAGIAGVGLATTSANSCEIEVASPFGPLTACASSWYVYTPAQTEPSMSAEGVATGTGGTATLWLFPTGLSLGMPTTYTFTATPPAGSAFGTATKPGVTVTGPTLVEITLSASLTLSGHVHDGAGIGVPNQEVWLQPSAGGANVFVRTDASGAFGFSVAAGRYAMGVNGNNPDFAYAVPGTYILNLGEIDLSNSAQFDIALPVHRVDVQVQDSSGLGIAGVGLATTSANSCDIEVASPFGPLTACASSWYVYTPAQTDPAMSAEGVATGTGGTATLWLFPTGLSFGMSTTYTFTATPPADSVFGTATKPGVTVTGTTLVDIALSASLTLSGHVRDGAGQAVPNQEVSLRPAAGGNNIFVRTDASGEYRFSVEPGQYEMGVNGNNPDFAYAVPGVYILNLATFDLSASTVFDIALPAHPVDVGVQDLGGAPVAGVGLATTSANTCEIEVASPFGPLTACASSWYFYTPAQAMPGMSMPAVGVATGTGGAARLWLFPTGMSLGAPTTYTFTATPPADGPFAIFHASGIDVQGPKDVVMVLQFVHDPPQTTLTAVSQPVDDVYPDPSEFALSATATSGFSVASVLFSVDDGPAAQYLAPFSVSGPGEHTIRYWSVDSGGVYELAHAFTFTIAEPAPPPPGYEFRGFFAPIENAPALNRAKAGSAVPVKFSLGGDHGLDVLEPGSPSVVETSCDHGTPMPETQTAAASGAGLRYDAAQDQYIFVWKTDRSWGNTCRQLVLTLRDGSTQRANFVFVK